MAIFTSKWTIAALALIAVLLIIYMLGRKSVHTELTIQVSPDKVWGALMEPKAWNPVLIPIEGELKEGAEIKYEFHQDENTTSEIPAKVKQMIPEKLLNQSGGMPGILTFDHKYILEPTDEGTLVTIHEDYRGIMVPFWNPAPVEKAYERLIEALKEHLVQSNHGQD